MQLSWVTTRCRDFSSSTPWPRLERETVLLQLDTVLKKPSNILSSFQSRRQFLFVGLQGRHDQIRRSSCTFRDLSVDCGDALLTALDAGYYVFEMGVERCPLIVQSCRHDVGICAKSCGWIRCVVVLRMIGAGLVVVKRSRGWKWAGVAKVQNECM